GFVSLPPSEVGVDGGTSRDLASGLGGRVDQSSGASQMLRYWTAFLWSWSRSGPVSDGFRLTPPGVTSISLSSMIVRPFWTTVRGAFFATASPSSLGARKVTS